MDETNRVSAGAPVIDAQAKPVFQSTLGLNFADPNLKLSTRDRRFQPQWFLRREDDLAVVTAEASNGALGILDIRIEAPTDKMKASGIICKVSMETLTGWDYGISIWGSKQVLGDIMLMVGGAREITPSGAERNVSAQEVVASEGAPVAKQKRNFIRDRKLNDATMAQILSYVYRFLKPVGQ